MRHLRNCHLMLAGAAALALSGAACAGIPTPRLHVDGNALKDTVGNTVVLRGASMIHIGWPWVYGYGTTVANTSIKNFLALTDTSKGWYPRVVRLPVADSVGPNGLFPLWSTKDSMDLWVAKNLQPIVDTAKARGVYVIIDFHLIDTVSPGKSDRCKRFWSYMAPKFASNDHVLYEVFNEPIGTPKKDYLWASLRDTAQAWVDTIRNHAPKTVVLVGGPLYSSILGGTDVDTITGGNIVYVAHMYPQNDVSGIKSQMRSVLANKHPVFLSEWGYDTTATAAVPTKGTTSAYAAPLRSFAASTGISWTAWCWSGSWDPKMWTSDLTPDSLTPFGAYAKSWLYDTRDSNLPSGVFVAVDPGNGGGSTTGGDSVVLASFNMPYGQSPRQSDLAASLGSNGGWWYTFKDDSGSTVTNGAGNDVVADTGAFSASVSNGAMHVAMSTSTSKMTYPYTGLEVNFVDSKTFFDLRKLTKLSLRLKGAVTGGKMRIHFLTRDVQLAKDWGNYGFDTKLDSAWSTIDIAASDLEPTPYSAAAKGGWTWADSGSRYVSGLGFATGNGVNADLWIDQITLYGIDSTAFTTPSSLSVHRQASMSRSLRSAMRVGDGLRVSYSLASAGHVEARLLDLQGRVLSVSAVDQVAGVHDLMLPLGTSGMAILQMRLGGAQETQLIQPVR